MATDIESPLTTKRGLILRDALTFLGLTGVTLVLFAITLFLFRSFAEHRSELARRWSDRGRADLSAGQPQRAIVSLRTALSYAPGERAYEMLLAQALGEAGRTDESFNYFTGLWDRTPGDGLINLRLARLAATKNDKAEAINFYRASIYGTWEGDGVERRRDVRLELARYLLKQHDAAAARIELLVAAGNSPETPSLDLQLAGLLEQAGAPSDALEFYRKVLDSDPKNAEAMDAAGQLAYRMGDFAEAHRLLQRAIRQESEQKDADHAHMEEIKTMSERADRILDLSPGEDLSAAERVRRILLARSTVRRRLEACAAAAGGPPEGVAELIATLNASDAGSTRSALLRDPSKQALALRLVYDTERRANGPCGEATGDDALLLLLAGTQKVTGR